jgi:hypothetical protein
MGLLPKLHITIPSEDFNAKFGRESNLSRRLGKSFHETIIDNCFKLINIAMSANLIGEATMIPIGRSHLDMYLMPDLSEELALILITVLTVKAQFTLEQAMKTQNGSNGIAVLVEVGW